MIVYPLRNKLILFKLHSFFRPRTRWEQAIDSAYLTWVGLETWIEQLHKTQHQSSGTRRQTDLLHLPLKTCTRINVRASQLPYHVVTVSCVKSLYISESEMTISIGGNVEVMAPLVRIIFESEKYKVRPPNFEISQSLCFRKTWDYWKGYQVFKMTMNDTCLLICAPWCWKS